MGAQNHQPTNRILTPLSAWLSQRVGEGQIRLLEANNHLENAIMIGMNKVYIEDLVPDLKGTCERHLNLSISELKKLLDVITMIENAFERLQNAADREGYQGNPLASQIKSFELSTKFQQHIVLPAVNEVAWNDVESRISSMNIMKTLAWESQEFSNTRQNTKDFIEVLSQCINVALSDGGLAFANDVEDNKIAVRQVGGRLLAQWNYLSAMFLYSSLMMTELFYKINAFPSLLEFSPEHQHTSAA